MTMTHWLMLIALLVSATVAIAVAYQQRKQMRQIELYKTDPSVGLIPPPSAITRFIKSHWDTVLGIGFPIVAIWIELSSAYPITRRSIFIVCLCMAIIVINIVMAFVFEMVRRLLSLIQSLNEGNKSNFEITSMHTKLIDKLADASLLPRDMR